MAKAYLYDLTDTWNAGATTFTAIKMNVTDTASASGSLLMDLQVGGSSRFSVTKGGAVSTAGGVTASGDVTSNSGAVYGGNGIQIGNGSALQFSDGVSYSTLLRADAANTLAQRNSTNAQAFRVYNTYTDASNYERGGLTWSGNVLTLGTAAAGTGALRDLELTGGATAKLVLGGVTHLSAVNGAFYICAIGETPSGGSSYIIGTNGNPLKFGTNNTDRWQINTSGHLLAGTDNTYDIGAGGATRPRNVYVAGQLIVPSIAAISNGYISFGAEGRFTHSGSDGVFRLQNNAGSGATLQFGGFTSSFPALKRNSTALETKLADDSAYAPHAMQYLDVTDGVTAPAAATGRARIYVDTADGDLKIIFADGTIKTIVTDT
jgi:hypothetical protein